MITTNPMVTSGRCGLRCNRNAPASTAANQTIVTTHPCHVIGGPQPHPYRLAGNQYDLSAVTVPPWSRYN